MVVDLWNILPLTSIEIKFEFKDNITLEYVDRVFQRDYPNLGKVDSWVDPDSPDTKVNIKFNKNADELMFALRYIK